MGSKRARRSRGRHAVRLAFLVAALVTLAAPALHGQLSATRPGDAAPAVASAARLDAGGATGGHLPHDATTCPRCIAIAQARTLIQAPVAPAASGPSGLLHLVEPSAPAAPASAPVFARSPRAPPRLPLSS